MTNQPFWKPHPTPPDQDWIAPLLRWSLAVSTLGWIVYGVFALAFDDIAVIPPALQSWLVVLGSMFIVAGAEMNTAPTVVAVARKWGRGKGERLDGVAFAVSLIGSVTAGLIAFSIRQTRLGDSGWRLLALNWGPLVVGIAIAADFYAASVELGLLRADYEREMEDWLEERRAWDDAHGNKPSRDGWGTAAIGDYRRVLDRMNGQRASLTAERLEAELAQDELVLPSASTVRRWLGMAQDGARGG